MTVKQEYITDLRKRLGLSAEKFGRLLGVSERTIRNWEKGLAWPSARNQEVIVRVDKLSRNPDIVPDYTSTLIVNQGHTLGGPTTCS